MNAGFLFIFGYVLSIRFNQYTRGNVLTLIPEICLINNNKLYHMYI